jgi:hypothetical protein
MTLHEQVPAIMNFEFLPDNGREPGDTTSPIDFSREPALPSALRVAFFAGHTHGEALALTRRSPFDPETDMGRSRLTVSTNPEGRHRPTGRAEFLARDCRVNRAWLRPRSGRAGR